MRQVTSNRVRYETTDFAKWASRRELDPQERWLIDHYLERGRDTMEAGTGGGSILFALRDEGFDSLAGFDYVPAMVESARAADPDGTIAFDVMDATRLTYADASFDQLIYLQVLLCLIESDEGRATAVSEAHRVLRPGGVAIFSLLSWEARRSQPVGRLLGPWLRVLRALRRADRDPRDWPHLYAGGRPNPGALLDQGPYIHWFTGPEARALFEDAGFVVDLSAGGSELAARRNGNGAAHDSGMYFVCSKP